MQPYTIPASASIGHVHLKVTDLERSVGFYRDVLGFQVTMYYGTQAAFLSAGGYHHHIGLNTWHSLDTGPAPKKSPGLYHVAILYPTRRDLAIAYNRVLVCGHRLTGAADHGVSEALYLDDPDGNGIELYADRPRELWPLESDGSVTMFTKELNIPDLLAELTF